MLVQLSLQFLPEVPYNILSNTVDKIPTKRILQRIKFWENFITPANVQAIFTINIKFDGP